MKDFALIIAAFAGVYGLTWVFGTIVRWLVDHCGAYLARIFW